MHEVRRDDGELCGYVARVGERWAALTVFAGSLGEHADEHEARRHVADDGLDALAERWTLVDPATGAEEIVCIQQASPTEVTIALDYYSLPGVPTMTIPVRELLEGRWRLDRRR